MAMLLALKKFNQIQHQDFVSFPLVSMVGHLRGALYEHVHRFQK